MRHVNIEEKDIQAFALRLSTSKIPKSLQTIQSEHKNQKKKKKKKEQKKQTIHTIFDRQ